MSGLLGSPTLEIVSPPILGWNQHFYENPEIIRNGLFPDFADQSSNDEIKRDLFPLYHKHFSRSD